MGRLGKAIEDLFGEASEAEEQFDAEEGVDRELYIIPDDKLKAAHERIQGFYGDFDRMKAAADALEELLPRPKPKPPYTIDHFKNEFFGYPGNVRIYKSANALSPISIALVTLKELFEDQTRFEFFNPSKLPGAARLGMHKPVLSDPTFRQVKLGPVTLSVPESGEFWLLDKKLGVRLIVRYGFEMSGFILRVESSYDVSVRALADQFVQTVNDAIFTSRYFRDQILELEGTKFEIIEIGDQKMPSLDPILKAELDKNVVNIFSRGNEFKSYNLPAKRSIIIEGPPGCGKTMACRYLAKNLKGTVTVLWVTAKSIDDADDVATIFDFARKLSPVLLIMEDMDLIAGTRTQDSGCLGEMLNQLDGLQPNDSIVMVATTNEVRSLDTALKDRPGRFDRIYEIGRPSGVLAEEIAKFYLGERGIPKELVDALAYGSVSRGDLTGAQIVEVCKGAIFEAIHRGIPINDFCLKSSYKSLMDQRRKILSEPKAPPPVPADDE